MIESGEPYELFLMSADIFDSRYDDTSPTEVICQKKYLTASNKVYDTFTDSLTATGFCFILESNNRNTVPCNSGQLHIALESRKGAKRRINDYPIFGDEQLRVPLLSLRMLTGLLFCTAFGLSL